MQTETITQRMALAAGIPPQTLNNAYLSTDGIDMQKSRRAIFELTMGALAAGSINAYLQESADNSTWPANGTASPFSGSGGANVSQTAMTTNNNIVTFEVNYSQLSPGKRYVRLNIQNSAATAAQVCVTSFGDEGEHKPNNINNAAAVGTQNVVA
jgi:hypothetical protein